MSDGVWAELVELDDDGELNGDRELNESEDHELGIAVLNATLELRTDDQEASAEEVLGTTGKMMTRRTMMAYPTTWRISRSLKCEHKMCRPMADTSNGPLR
jgi:hypothetical protein